MLISNTIIISTYILSSGKKVVIIREALRREKDIYKI